MVILLYQKWKKSNREIQRWYVPLIMCVSFWVFSNNCTYYYICIFKCPFWWSTIPPPSLKYFSRFLYIYPSIFVFRMFIRLTVCPSCIHTTTRQTVYWSFPTWSYIPWVAVNIGWHLNHHGSGSFKITACFLCVGLAVMRSIGWIDGKMEENIEAMSFRLYI